MSAPLEQSRNDVLHAAAATLRPTLQKVRGRRAAAPEATSDAFLKAYYRLVATEDLLARDPAELAATALAHKEFAQKRMVGTFNVRVVNPQVDADGKARCTTPSSKSSSTTCPSSSTRSSRPSAALIAAST